MMMDAVFERDNFRNEIVWCYAGGNPSRKNYPKKHDILLKYSVTEKHTFNVQYRPYSDHNTGGKRFSTKGMSKRRGLNYRPEGTPVNDWWVDIKPLINLHKERTGYPTQKPLALLDRIIKTSSNEGDIVLDPFCGCATTCVAAESLQRQWIGIDLSPKAVELVKMRLERDLSMTEDTGLLGDKVIHRTDIPTREVPDEPRQIHAATLFGTRSEIERVLSEVELHQYRSYKHTLFGLQEGKCNGCEVLFPFRNMTIDHIIPRSRGGTDDPDNLQLLCAACNSTKSNRTQDELIQSLREQGVLRE